MRNFILAFGLLILPAITMAAPSNPCSTEVVKNVPVLKSCSAKERKQFAAAFDAASSKPTTKAVDKVLRARQGKFYLAIRTVCFGRKKATRKSVSSRAIERCASRLDYSPRAVVLYAQNNIKAIKKCVGIKSYRKQLNCMIDSPNSKELEDIILAALDLRDAYWKGLKTLKKFGCKLKGRKLQCASSAGLVLAALFMFLLGRLRPQLRTTIGVVAMIIGAVYANTANAACTNAKLLPALTKLSTSTNLKGETVEVKMPRIVSVIVNKCVLETSRDIAFLEVQKKELMKAYEVLAGPSSAMVGYCTTLRGTDNIRACFDAQEKATEELNILVHKAQKLYWDRHEMKRKEDRAAKEAAKAKAAQELLEEGNKQLEESQKVLDALIELNDVVVEEGSCGGFLIVLIYGLLGFLGGCRSKLLVVLVALGSMTSLADAAAKGGCSVDSDENIIELFEASCSTEVLQSLIEEEGLICTEEHRMEGASLSMAAPTKQGLSKEADLRHRFLEALCFSESSLGIFMLLGMFFRRKEIAKDKQKRYYPAFDMKQWALNSLDELNTEEVGKITVFQNQIVEVEKGRFEVGCEVTIATMVAKKTKEVTNRITTVRSSNGNWVREGFKGYYKKTL